MMKQPPNLISLIQSFGIEEYQQINKDILTHALIHKSFKFDKNNPDKIDNERLEYLGDAVLKLSVSQWLYETLPETDEGKMSHIRAYVVSDKTLSKIAKNLKLGDYIILADREARSGGKHKPSILANVMEAIFGAIFLSTNFDFSAKVIINLLKEELKSAIKGKSETENYKDTLQKITQEKFKILPDYNTKHVDGPAHKAIFETVLKLNNKEFKGRGASKKEAEQIAASLAIKDLNNEK